MASEREVLDAEPVPIGLSRYIQTHGYPRLPVFGGGRTKPGRWYLVGRLEVGGPQLAIHGPFVSDHEVDEALGRAKVRAPSEKERKG